MSEAMTSLERVGAILQHKEADRVPVYPLINGVNRTLIGADYPTWTRDPETTCAGYLAATEQLGLDCIVTLTDLSVEAGDFGQEIIYPANEAAHPNFGNHLLKSIADYRKVEPIAPGERMSAHIRLCDMLAKARGKDTPIVAFVFGPLGIVSMLRGQGDLYMDLVDDPDAVRSAVDAVTESLIAYCDKLLETGIHAIMLDTLFSSQSIMSKAMWDAAEGPAVQRLAEHIHGRGAMVMIHNCGKGIYFDAQIERMKPDAISFLHLPPDCRTGEELKAKYGGKTTLIGHIDPIWVATAPDAAIREECERQMGLYAKDGGYILATGCEYPSGADLRAARTMIEAAKAHKYA